MTQRFYYQHGDDLQAVTLTTQADGLVRVMVGEQVYVVRPKQVSRDEVTFEFQGRVVTVHVAHAGPRRYVQYEGQSWQLERLAKLKKARPKMGDAASGQLTASMPGQVLALGVQLGQEVRAGEMLVLLEAMKMELRLAAPFAGRVTQVHCQVGQIVERGQVLVEISPHP